ncbi:hypothetical protein [Chryseobacterium sp. JUb7]|uniref:hypothetical protein n=1 Tax=Chryseobacterium sp. JUb7 TaxID=2940599 RepID=UPI00216920A5|nr:hypothetical protein [Chryseobacterium sp. JUb7]MCS3529798.1 hypothetical protein [Chryseobacterium sp. JUb7]
MISKNPTEITDPIAHPDEGAKEETSAETLESIYQNILHSAEASESTEDEKSTQEQEKVNQNGIPTNGENSTE